MRIENEQLKLDQKQHNCNVTDKDLLTPKEAANKLKVTSEQIRSLIRKGQLPAVNISTGTKRPLYRITHQALSDFLNRRWQPTLQVQKRRFKRLSPVPDFFPNLK
jgi:excisionase family DNA binding protein